MNPDPNDPRHYPTARPAGPPPGDGGVSTIIPYKNAQALIAYYLGVFGLIPVLGLPLALAAVIFGFLGLNFAKKYPEAKGKAHAVTGIVLGLGSMLVCGVGPVAWVVFVANTR